jgi:AcrR family transcriptional regulator
MGELDSDRIAAAALAVADEHGAEGFTMRAVAEALRVTPMALYHHVADKSALVRLVVDRVIAEQPPLPPSSDSWRDDLWEMACWMRRTALAHPSVSELSRAHKIWTPAVIPMTERWFGIWQLSGLPVDGAVRAASISSMAIVGLVAEEQVFRDMTRPDDDLLAWSPNARSAFAREPDRDADFELVVRSLIDGIHARMHYDAQTDSPRNRPRKARQAQQLAT